MKQRQDVPLSRRTSVADLLHGNCLSVWEMSRLARMRDKRRAPVAAANGNDAASGMLVPSTTVQPLGIRLWGPIVT